jgi:hypothetical protein
VVNKHIKARTLLIAEVLAATIVLGIDGRFGPQPWVWNFKYGAVIVHLPWLVALFLISAAQHFCLGAGVRIYRNAFLSRSFPLSSSGPSLIYSRRSLLLRQRWEAKGYTPGTSWAISWSVGY